MKIYNGTHRRRECLVQQFRLCYLESDGDYPVLPSKPDVPIIWLATSIIVLPYG